ncbi:hypothetical protein ACHAW5_001744 [Stephanodiscus triporus]|uniref:Uncharacterized protein n=1 Tax=Stephanodiscus triporus TaxID=2934178 RepID=A0ABD3QTW9_9STRA
MLIIYHSFVNGRQMWLYCHRADASNADGPVKLTIWPPPAAPTGRRRRRDGPPMRHGSRLLDDDGDGTIERDDDGETGNGGTAVGASPLWEHAEAFRRAAILGLIFDNINDDDGGDCSDIFAAFSDVVRREGRSGHVAGYRTNVLQQANIADHGILLSVRTRRRRRHARGASAVVRSIDGRRVVGDDQRS